VFFNSFLQVPAILAHHEVFLEELRKRLQHWDVKQKVGDVFLDVVSKIFVGVNSFNDAVSTKLCNQYQI
jgi:hypothetical protein